MMLTWRAAAVALGLTLITILAVFPALRQHDLSAQVHRNCLTSQQAWDSRHEIVIAVTVPVEFAPTDSPDLRAAERRSNRTRAVQRAALLRSAGDRPRCGK